MNVFVKVTVKIASLLLCQRSFQVSLFSNGNHLTLGWSSSAVCNMFNVLLPNMGAGTILHIQTAHPGETMMMHGLLS